MPPSPIALPQGASTLQRNLTRDLSAAVGIGATMAVVGSLLPALARIDGLGSVGLATLAAIPFLASLFGLLAGRIGPRTPAGLAVVRAVGSAALLLVFVSPQPLVIALVSFVFWAALNLGAPLQQRLWTAMYPLGRRGQLIGLVGTGRSGAGMVALMICGMAIDGSIGLVIIAVVAVLGAISALAVARLEVLEDADPDSQRFSMADAMRSIVRNPVLRPATFAQMVFGTGLVAVPALVALVQIDRLGLGLHEVALAGIATYLTTTIAFSAWGRLANRIGGLRTVAVGSSFGVLALLLFAAAPDLLVIVIAAGSLGIGQAAVDVSWPLIIGRYASEEDQAPAAAGFAAVMGVRGLVAPFLVMVPVQLGWLDVTTGLLLGATATATGVLLYARLAGLLHVPALPIRRAAVVGVVTSVIRP